MIKIFKLKEVYDFVEKTKQDMIKDFFFWETSINGEDLMICKMIDDKIIGLIAMEYNHYNKTFKTLYVNVMKEYRNSGVAKDLIRYQINYILENNYVLKNTVYTQEGLKYIKKYYDELTNHDYFYYEDID